MFEHFGTPLACACLQGGEENPQLHGTVKLYPHCCGVLLVAQIWGLPSTESGFFALHIHDGVSCQGEGFPESGSHYNPGLFQHPSHAGDLPPLLACKGCAYLAVVTDRFRICEVIGKTVIVHRNADDFTTQPSGNAGEKIACGIFRKT